MAQHQHGAKQPPGGRPGSRSAGPLSDRVALVPRAAAVAAPAWRRCRRLSTAPRGRWPWPPEDGARRPRRARSARPRSAAPPSRGEQGAARSRSPSEAPSPWGRTTLDRPGLSGSPCPKARLTARQLRPWRVRTVPTGRASSSPPGRRTATSRTTVPPRPPRPFGPSPRKWRVRSCAPAHSSWIKMPVTGGARGPGDAEQPALECGHGGGGRRVPSSGGRHRRGTTLRPKSRKAGRPRSNAAMSSASEAQGEDDASQPLSSRSRVNFETGKVPASPAAGASIVPGRRDRDLQRGPRHRVEQGAVGALGDLDRERPLLLRGVVAEDVGEKGQDDGLEPKYRQGVDGGLARGAGAEFARPRGSCSSAGC